VRFLLGFASELLGALTAFSQALRGEEKEEREWKKKRMGNGREIRKGIMEGEITRKYISRYGLEFTTP